MKYVILWSSKWPGDLLGGVGEKILHGLCNCALSDDIGWLVSLHSGAIPESAADLGEMIFQSCLLHGAFQWMIISR